MAETNARCHSIAAVSSLCDPERMTFCIRAATLADIPAMHKVRRSVRENRLGDPTRITEDSYRHFIEAGSIWVALGTDEEVIGFSAVDQDTKGIWALFVDPDHEGIGIGRTLHDTMLDWASRHGAHALWLETAPGTRAERFYIDAGWQKKAASGTAETRFEKILGS
jgi:GNAT superfamily N-acetyltransferase